MKPSKPERDTVEAVKVGPTWAVVALKLCGHHSARGKGYTLMHVPSGRTVGSRYRGSKRDTLRVAQEVATRWPALYSTDNAALAQLGAFLETAMGPRVKS